MDPQQIKELLQAIRLELIRYKEWCVAIFIIISLAALGLGYIWPQKFTTSATLNADESNIIAPLLSGRAEVTRPDRTQDAKEVMQTRQFLERVVFSAKLVDKDDAPSIVERNISDLRSQIKIIPINKTYFSLTYSSGNQDRSFMVLSEMVKEFIAYASKRKKEESFSAFQFIDAQVQAYKRQLEEAEEKLKVFKSSNIDGTEASVASRISTLRTEIENLNLQIEESSSRITASKKQLESESTYLKVRSRLESLEGRKAGLVTELENLRLTYQENYPDVVSLKLQIEELDRRIAEIYELEGLSASASTSSNNAENPLYEELRKQLVGVEVDLKAQNQRQASLKRLLKQEYARAEKIASNEAELSELTRDYDVTKRVYEEMLDRKEKARMSMALDIEGQGVTYKIHEPPVYPLETKGLRFIHFAIIGPFLGFLIPFGLVIALIMVDPRIRSSISVGDKFEDEVELIGVVPHSSTALSKRIIRRDAVIILTIMVCFLVVYTAVVANKVIVI